MSLNFEEVNILGSIVDDTWGKSNDESGGAFKLLGKVTGEGRLQITCMVVVNLYQL